MPEYLTMKETQDLLGVDEDTLFNLIQENKIRNYRIDREMRFKEAEVLAYRTGMAAAAAGPDDVTTETLLDLDDGIPIEPVRVIDPADEHEIVTETMTSVDSQLFDHAAVQEAAERNARTPMAGTKMSAPTAPSAATPMPMFGDQTLDLIDETATVEESAPVVPDAEQSKTERNAPTGKADPVTGPMRTEEIHFDNDEFSLVEEEGKTQEITVVEAPVTSTATPSSTAGAMATQPMEQAEEDEDPLAVGASPKDMKRAQATESRTTRGSSAGGQPGRRRAAAVRGGDGLGLLWGLVLLVPVAISLMLVALMVNLAFSGFTTKPETIVRSNLHLDRGIMPEVGSLQPTWEEGGWFGSVADFVGTGDTQLWGKPELRKPEAPAAAATPSPEGTPPAEGAAVEAAPAPAQ